MPRIHRVGLTASATSVFTLGPGEDGDVEFDLDRFRRAQEDTYTGALDELRRGRKTGHWIWWVMPQMRGLGHSSNSHYYGLSGFEEARAYFADDLLGARLRESIEAVLEHRVRGAEAVLGFDAIKLRSCLTLFHRAVPQEPLFAKGLDVLFGGLEDPLTLELLGLPD